VLGVIRPTTEKLGVISTSGAVGILGTQGTVQSASYSIELAKFYPELKVYQQACPMWVPLVENGEHTGPGADYFVANDLRQLLQQDPSIDTLLLACTHYPLLLSKISAYAGPNRQIITQGPLVAESLADYLHRHPDMEKRLNNQGKRAFYTTDSAERFNQQAALFFGEQVKAEQLILAH
jgi:glutamate racemase